MADTAAGGYNPGASMLSANPDVSLKVFMGGGADADGGTGMAYNATQSMLQQVPGAALQKFDGGAMRVPGAEGQGRLLQDILGVQDVPVKYEEKNNVIRSMDDLRAAFQTTDTYNQFIDWLGGKLLNNDLFKKFVAERMLTIKAEGEKPRAKRRTREQIIADELQKSIAKIAKAQEELTRLEKLKKEAEQAMQVSTDKTEAQKTITRTDDRIKETQKMIADAIAQSTTITSLDDIALERLADGTGKPPVRTLAPKPAVVPEEAAVVPSAPPAAGEEAKKEVAATPGAPEVEVKQQEQGVSSAPVLPPFGTVGNTPQLVNNSVPKSPTSIVNTPPPAPQPVSEAKGGARKAKRTLKSRPQKGRATLKRK